MIEIIEARISVNQTGIAVDVRKAGEKDWQLLDLYPFKQYNALPAVQQYRTCIDPARQIEEVESSLRRQGVVIIRGGGPRDRNEV